MDPNATLANMREAVKQFRDAERTSIAEDPVDEAAHSMADAFEALDDFLTKGGFLPDAWLTPRAQIVEAEIVDDLDKQLFDAVLSVVVEENRQEQFPAEPVLVVFGSTEYDNGYFLREDGLVHFGGGVEPADIDFGRAVEVLLGDIGARYAIGGNAGLTVDLRTGEVGFEDYIDMDKAETIAARIKATDGATS